VYLFTFGFMLICVLGIYTQVYAVQAARMFASQTTIADDMLTWHSAAVEAVEQGVAASTSAMKSPGTTGCGLTAANGQYTTALCSTAYTANHYMPTGYNPNYNWNSYVYQASTGGQSYVVTWAPPPSSGNLSDPIQNPPIGINLSDLYTQIRNNPNIPLYGYGIAKNGQLPTPVPVNNTFVTYPLPPAVPNGSVALISVP